MSALLIDESTKKVSHHLGLSIAIVLGVIMAAIALGAVIILALAYRNAIAAARPASPRKFTECELQQSKSTENKASPLSDRDPMFNRDLELGPPLPPKPAVLKI